jgi:hypothetical protein
MEQASLAENVAFNALVVMPNLVQGLFRPRATAVRAATAANVDGRAVAMIDGLRRAHGRQPIWVHAGSTPSLLLLDPDDIRRVLVGSPHPFAPDPEIKRKGMTHFQPNALTISRADEWEPRRRFTESILAADARVIDIVRSETTAALAPRSTIGWQQWSDLFRRLTRRIVLGESAADDEHVTDLLVRLMDEANGLPERPTPKLNVFLARVAGYVDSAEPGSLVAHVRDAAARPGVDPVGQVPHWLFAMGETLAINSYRALVLLTASPSDDLTYVEACLQEAMRLWPTTKLLVRVSVANTDWYGDTVPSGTQFLISNTFNHRDPSWDAADRFAPELWTDGEGDQNWALNHLSNGPQRCAGAGLALLIGTHALTTAVQLGARAQQPVLDIRRPLPHVLDHFRICVTRDGVMTRAC